MTTTELPPFAPALDAESQAARLLLSQGERKRTGHLYKDCPALDVKAPGKPKACKPCLDRHQDVGRLARTHQQQYDAAWYAQAAAQEAPMQPAYVSAAQANEDDIWESVAKADTPPPAKREHRPNKFGGKCQHCAGWVEAGAGALGKDRNGKWVIAHIDSCPEAAPAAVAAEPLRAGPYRLADGTVVRIQIARTSGKPYAVALDEGAAYLGGGRILDGAVRLTLEEAKEWGRESVTRAKAAGKEYGTCCVCGAHLEDPVSVANGIGPICGGRM